MKRKFATCYILLPMHWMPLLKEYQYVLDLHVIPMDAIKESVDAAVKNRAQNKNLPDDGFEISISGCNMPESVRKNLPKLTKAMEGLLQVLRW